jgi:hypothetical protein
MTLNASSLSSSNRLDHVEAWPDWVRGMYRASCRKLVFPGHRGLQRRPRQTNTACSCRAADGQVGTAGMFGEGHGMVEYRRCCDRGVAVGSRAQRRRASKSHLGWMCTGILTIGTLTEARGSTGIIIRRFGGAFQVIFHSFCDICPTIRRLERSQDRDPIRQGGVLCEGVHVLCRISRLANPRARGGVSEIGFPVVSVFDLWCLDIRSMVI